MDKFEYDIREIKPGEKPLDKLNEWGNDGWELSCLSSYTREQIMYPPFDAIDTRPRKDLLLFVICYLKREKS